VTTAKDENESDASCNGWRVLDTMNEQQVSMDGGYSLATQTKFSWQAQWSMILKFEQLFNIYFGSVLIKSR